MPPGNHALLQRAAGFVLSCCNGITRKIHRWRSDVALLRPPHPTPLMILVAGFARIRAFWARSLKSCDFSYNQMPLFFRIDPQIVRRG
jgi:hypothetical protein